jgi:hypothetical protein
MVNSTSMTVTYDHPCLSLRGDVEITGEGTDHDEERGKP